MVKIFLSIQWFTFLEWLLWISGHYWTKDVVFIILTCFRPEDEQSPAAASQTASLIEQTFLLRTANTTVNEPCVSSCSLHSDPFLLVSTDFISLLIKYLPCPAKLYELHLHTTAALTPQSFLGVSRNFTLSPQLSKTCWKHFIIMSAQ